MKKVSLLSLLAVLAVSSAASAANIEDPLYAPAAKKVYSKTSLDFNKDFDVFVLTEKVGYGFTDKISGHAALNFIHTDDENGFGHIEFGGKYRALTGSTILDIYADVGHSIKKELAALTGGEGTDFDLGVVVGTQTQKYTIAGKLGLDAFKPKSGDLTKQFEIGVEGVYAFDDKWSVQGSLESNFGGDCPDDFGSIDLTIQGNYAATSGLWSLAITKDIKNSDVDEAYTLKYGIQF